MPKTSKSRLVTRQKSKLQYEEGPCELANTEPSANKQLLQCYYHIKNSKP